MKTLRVDATNPAPFVASSSRSLALHKKDARKEIQKTLKSKMKKMKDRSNQRLT